MGHDDEGITSVKLHACPSGFAVVATWIGADGEERSEHGTFSGAFGVLDGLAAWLADVGAVEAVTPATPGFAPPSITTWAEVHPGDLVAPGYRSPVGRPADGDWRRVRSVASAGRKLVEVVCAGESPAKHIETGEVWVMVAVGASAAAPVASSSTSSLSAVAS